MAEFDPYRMIVRPVMTERSTNLKDRFHQYVFEVESSATKGDIRRAVEQLFKVAVVGVRTMRVPGKWRRVGKSAGRRPDWKKAIVTLQSDQKIDLLEAA